MFQRNIYGSIWSCFKNLKKNLFATCYYSYTFKLLISFDKRSPKVSFLYLWKEKLSSSLRLASVLEGIVCLLFPASDLLSFIQIRWSPWTLWQGSSLGNCHQSTRSILIWKVDLTSECELISPDYRWNEIE